MWSFQRLIKVGKQGCDDRREEVTIFVSFEYFIELLCAVTWVSVVREPDAWANAMLARSMLKLFQACS